MRKYLLACLGVLGSGVGGVLGVGDGGGGGGGEGWGCFGSAWIFPGFKGGQQPLPEYIVWPTVTKSTTFKVNWYMTIWEGVSILELQSSMYLQDVTFLYKPHFRSNVSTQFSTSQIGWLGEKFWFVSLLIFSLKHIFGLFLCWFSQVISGTMPR